QRCTHRTPATYLSLRLAGAATHGAVFSSFALMVASHATNPSDIIQLYNEYSNAGSTAPVELLRHPAFFSSAAAQRRLPCAHAPRQRYWPTISSRSKTRSACAPRIGTSISICCHWPVSAPAAVDRTERRAHSHHSGWPAQHS